MTKSYWTKKEMSEIDISDVEIECLGEIDINEYIKKKILESLQKEENSRLL